MTTTLSCPEKNLTATFIKLRAANKNKQQNRFKTLDSNDVPLHSSDPLRYNTSYRRLSSPRSTTITVLQNTHTLDPMSSVRDPSYEHNSIEMCDILPPIWVDFVEETHDDLLKAKEKLSVLQKLQQKRFLHMFGEYQSTVQPDEEIDTLSDNLTQLLKKCEQRIFTIGPPPGSSQHDIQLRTNAQKSLAIQVQSVSHQMRLQQNYYIGELRKRRQYELDHIDQDTTLHTDNIKKVEQEQSSLYAIEDSETNSNIRIEEITNIAQSIAELQSIFHELNLLVIDQGTLLNRIDYQMEQTVDQTSGATQQIKKAEIYQRSGRAGKVILGLFILITFLVLNPFMSTNHSLICMLM